MLLSTQLIQWNAVQMKNIPAASSLLAGGKVAHLKMKLPQKNSPRIKRHIHTWWTWCLITWKEYSIQYSKNQWYLIKNVVEITDQNRCILFGPPCICSRQLFWINVHFKFIHNSPNQCIQSRASKTSWTFWILRGKWYQEKNFLISLRLFLYFLLPGGGGHSILTVTGNVPLNRVWFSRSSILAQGI